MYLSFSILTILILKAFLETSTSTHIQVNRSVQNRLRDSYLRHKRGINILDRVYDYNKNYPADPNNYEEHALINDIEFPNDLLDTDMMVNEYQDHDNLAKYRNNANTRFRDSQDALKNAHRPNINSLEIMPDNTEFEKDFVKNYSSKHGYSDRKGNDVAMIKYNVNSLFDDITGIDMSESVLEPDLSGIDFSFDKEEERLNKLSDYYDMGRAHFKMINNHLVAKVHTKATGNTWNVYTPISKFTTINSVSLSDSQNDLYRIRISSGGNATKNAYIPQNTMIVDHFNVSKQYGSKHNGSYIRDSQRNLSGILKQSRLEPNKISLPDDTNYSYPAIMYNSIKIHNINNNESGDKVGKLEYFPFKEKSIGLVQKNGLFITLSYQNITKIEGHSNINTSPLHKKHRKHHSFKKKQRFLIKNLDKNNFRKMALKDNQGIENFTTFSLTSDMPQHNINNLTMKPMQSMLIAKTNNVKYDMIIDETYKQIPQSFTKYDISPKKIYNTIINVNRVYHPTSNIARTYKQMPKYFSKYDILTKKIYYNTIINVARIYYTTPKVVFKYFQNSNHHDDIVNLI
ncbi:unnamed protein product [Gordionus sp. m RMFG-2023]